MKYPPILRVPADTHADPVCAFRPAETQEAAKIPGIGILQLGSRSASAEGHRALQQGLRELGYIEGKNVVFEYRYANGKLDLLPRLAAS
ncbi:MAG TPA: hypothetical protein VGH22_15910 [Candidatus Binatia bacterium]